MYRNIFDIFSRSVGARIFRNMSIDVGNVNCYTWQNIKLALWYLLSNLWFFYCNILYNILILNLVFFMYTLIITIGKIEHGTYWIFIFQKFLADSSVWKRVLHILKFERECTPSVNSLNDSFSRGIFMKYSFCNATCIIVCKNCTYPPSVHSATFQLCLENFSNFFRNDIKYSAV